MTILGADVIGDAVPHPIRPRAAIVQRLCAATSEGWPPFSRSAIAGTSQLLYAFDLLELNGTDLRREPIEVRKATLASILARAGHGVRLNEHLEHPTAASRLPARLQDGARRDRLETAGIALSVGAVAGLAQVQESGGSGGEAGGGGGLGAVMVLTIKSGGNRINPVAATEQMFGVE